MYEIPTQSTPEQILAGYNLNQGVEIVRLLENADEHELHAFMTQLKKKQIRGIYNPICE
ncbi:MAG: hypothetical protein Q8P11_03275 [bacterium]|nr:hypothetical protein [bacterium]